MAASLPLLPSKILDLLSVQNVSNTSSILLSLTREFTEASESYPNKRDEIQLLAQLLAHCLQRHCKQSHADISCAQTSLIKYFTKIIENQSIETDEHILELIHVGRTASIHQPTFDLLIDSVLDSLQEYAIFCHFGMKENKILNYMHVDISDHLNAHAPGFLTPPREGHKSLVFEQENLDQLELRAISLLQFLKYLAVETQRKVPSTALERLLNCLVAAMASKNDELAYLALPIYQQYIPYSDEQGASESIYSVIRTLSRNSSRAEIASSIWVSWVGQSRTVGPKKEMVASAEYWRLIHSGIAHAVSLRRKNCFYILSKSLNLIEFDVENRYMIWEASKAEEYRSTWGKYLTLVDIIDLDASANQFHDALPVIEKLLTPPHNIIPGLWISVLFALAFRSTSTAIAKIAYDIIFSLPSEKLGFWMGDREFLLENFLPIMIMPAYFTVRADSLDKCRHFDLLSSTLARLVRATSDSIVVRSLLEFLNERNDNIFAPARIAILKGIADGLSANPTLQMADVPLVLKCAEMKRMGNLRTDFCTVLCTEIVKTAIISNSVDGCYDYLRAISTLIKDQNHLLHPRQRSFIINKVLDTLKYAEPDAITVLARRSLADRVLDGVILTLIALCKPKAFEKAIADNSNVEFIHALLASTASSISLDELQKLYSDYNSSWASTLRIVETKIHDFRNDLSILKSVSNIIHNVGEVSTPTDESLCHELWHSVREIEIDNTHPIFLSCKGLGADDVQGMEQLERAAVLAQLWHGKELLAENCENATPTYRKLQDSVYHLLSKLRIPVHESDESFNAMARTHYTKLLRHLFELLNLTIQRQKFSRESNFRLTLREVLSIIQQQRRHVENESIYSVLKCVQSSLDQCSTEDIPEEPLLDLLTELWDSGPVMRNGAEPRRVVVELIKTSLHPVLFRMSLDVEVVERFMIQTVKNTMNYGTGRRTIVPQLAQCLHAAFVAHPSVFFQVENIAQTMISILGYEIFTNTDNRNEVPLSRCFTLLFNDGDKYEQYYGVKEVKSRASIFGILLSLNERDERHREFAVKLRTEILKVWAKASKNTAIYTKDKKTAYLQALIVLERFVKYEETDKYFDSLMRFASKEGHPRHRFLFEWLISLFIIRRPEYRGRIWTALNDAMTTEKQNPKFHGSLVNILMMSARHVEKENREAYYGKLITSLIPLTSHAKVAVRHMALTSTLAIWDDVLEFGYTKFTLNPLLVAIKDSVLNSAFHRECAAKGQIITVFNPLANLTLAGLFCGHFLEGADQVESIPPSMVTFHSNIAGIAQCPLPLGSMGDLPPNLISYNRSEEKAIAPEEEASPKPSTLQTKTRVAPTAAIPHTLSGKLETSLILVASFVSSPPNLGGLSRASEIFGVEELYVADDNVVSDKAFSSVSVSSEKWIPIRKLQPTIEDMRVFFDSKRGKGYTIVGIEQTDGSKILGEYAFPKKTVLVLGSEKHGIPSEVLGMMDVCVVIRQRGETRSLNVQVAAGVTIAEFNRQYGL